MTIMISDFSRPLTYMPRFAVPALVLLISFTISLPLLAQNTKHKSCRANESGDGWDCVYRQPDTAPLTAAKPVAAAAPLTAGTSLPTPTSSPVAHSLDWVPQMAVPAALRDLDCKLCDGRYIDPLKDADRDANPNEADIQAWANSTELQGDTVRFTGGVSVTQGYR